MKKLSAIALAVIVSACLASVTRADEDEKQDFGDKGQEEKEQAPPTIYKLKKVVKYRTVTEYETRKEKYTKVETVYDECNRPQKVYKTYYRDVKVPVTKEVPVVIWVKVVVPMKKVVTYRTVTEYEIVKEKYTKVETVYDECNRPQKVYKTYYRDVKVPVTKKVRVVTWVPDYSGGEYRDEERETPPPVPDDE